MRIAFGMLFFRFQPSEHQEQASPPILFCSAAIAERLGAAARFRRPNRTESQHARARAEASLVAALERAASLKANHDALRAELHARRRLQRTSSTTRG